MIRVTWRLSSQRIPLCTSGDLDEAVDCSPDSSDTQDDVLSGWVPKNVIWKGRDELGVKFLNNVPADWTYAGSGMNIGNIMSWANEWSLRGNGVIPKFTLVQETNARSDIRVEFTCESKFSRTISILFLKIYSWWDVR